MRQYCRNESHITSYTTIMFCIHVHIRKHSLLVEVLSDQISTFLKEIGKQEEFWLFRILFGLL